MRIHGEDAFETANLDDFAAQAMHILRLARAAIMHHARQALRRMRRRPTLVIAFWQQAELFPL